MVLAQADIVARVPLGAALAHDDVAGAHGLAAELLDAEALAFTVAAVAGRAACFLMCHVELLRFRRLLGCRLSRCSIFCRPALGLGLGRSSLFRGTRGLLVVRGGILGRGPDDLIGFLLGLGRVDGFLRTCSRSLLDCRLRRGLGFRSGLLGFLVVAYRDDLEDRVLLAVALLAAVVVAPPLLEDGDLVGLGL